MFVIETDFLCLNRDLKIKEKSYAAIEAYLKYLYTDKIEADLNLAVGKHLNAAFFNIYFLPSSKFLCRDSYLS